MKSIHDCDPQERMLRALLALDGLTFFQEDILNKKPETPVEHFVHDVYTIAHSASGCCGNPHTDELDKIDETFVLLEKANILTNVDEKVEEIQMRSKDRGESEPNPILTAIREAGRRSRHD